MNYVEMLRVRNVLRVFGIVLLCLLAVAVYLRVTLNGQLNGMQSIVDREMKKPGAQVTHSVADGMQRTIIVNQNEHLRIQIDESPDGGRTIDIDEPTSNTDYSAAEHTFGSVRMSERSASGTRHMSIDTNAQTNVAYYLLAALFVGLIISTVLGASFAKEGEGHLEFALTKPVSRLRFALGNVGVDFAGILIAEVMVMIAGACAQLLFEVPHFTADVQSLYVLLIAVLGPFAWYAMLNAATASMRRGANAIVGLSWIIAFGIIGAGKVHLPTALGDAMHAIFSTLARLLPMSYVELSVNDNGIVMVSGASAQTASTPINAVALLVLLLIYSALAVWQWRRVEA